MWDEVSLSDLFRIGSSKRVLKSQWEAEGVPFYRGREVTKLSKDGFVDNELFISEELYKEYSEKYGVPQSGDIVITAIGTIGNSYIVRDGDRFYFKDASVLWLKRASDVVSEFIDYWLKSSLMKEQLDEGNGATVDTLTIKKLQSLKIRLPSCEEQKRIVAILDEAFAGIDTAIANTEKNLANARELFESYLNSVFTKRGDGWIDQKFGEICGFVRGPFGGSLKKSCFVEEGFAVYEQQHAINDQFESIRYFIDDTKFQEMQRFELLPGDLIMSCSGTMGRVAIVPETIKRGVINQALLKLTPSNKIDAQYLRLWMESDSFMEEIEKHSQGAAIKNVASVKILKEIEVPSPVLLKQKEIVSEVLEYREQINQLESIYQRKLASLKELKQSLLQKAFSGELTAEADKLMDEAVA